jgi:death on curing protein
LMRYLTLGEILALHEELIRRHGGAGGLLDRAGLESALAQPRQTFEGREHFAGGRRREHRRIGS